MADVRHALIREAFPYKGTSWPSGRPVYAMIAGKSVDEAGAKSGDPGPRATKPERGIRTARRNTKGSAPSGEQPGTVDSPARRRDVAGAGQGPTGRSDRRSTRLKFPMTTERALRTRRPAGVCRSEDVIIAPSGWVARVAWRWPMFAGHIGVADVPRPWPHERVTDNAGDTPRPGVQNARYPMGTERVEARKGKAVKQRAGPPTTER